MAEEYSKDILSEGKKSIVLLQGIFSNSFFDLLRERGVKEVFIMEGRPSCEAAESSCKELIKRKIKPTLIADNMAGFLFYKDLIKEVWLSYHIKDKDGALCYIGALILGILAKRHGITVNLYPNEHKMALLGKEKEVIYFDGIKVAPPNVRGYVPLAEWVSSKYITKAFNVIPA